MNPSELTHLHLKKLTENWRHSHILKTANTAWVRCKAWKLFVSYPGLALLTHICICNNSPIWLRVGQAWCRDIAWRLFVGHPGPAFWPFCKLCTIRLVEVRFPSWDREAFLNFIPYWISSQVDKGEPFIQNYILLFNLVGISLVIWRLQQQRNTLDYEYQKCFEDF